MNAPIIVVLGNHAQECAAVLAATDGVAIAAHWLERFQHFQPMRPVFLHAREYGELAPWLRRAAAMLLADNRTAATVTQGRFGGACKGRSVK